jgi:phospholipid/cholesterol/gamma-HCH transport system permease protein
LAFFEYIGRGVLRFFEGIGKFIIFSLLTIRWCFARPFDIRNLITQMSEIGVKSIPVTTITSFFTGMVMAMNLGAAMEKKIQGISIYMGGSISLAMVRELSPVLTALLLSGRVGSSMAAQIGTMKVTEQIDALTTLATNPIHYLSVPRFLASLIMIPLICVLTMAVGILGGALFSYFSMDILFSIYFDSALLLVHTSDFLQGIIKTAFFGMEIALISTYFGFQTGAGAEGVGKSTISAVVTSSMTILISDYFITDFLNIILD